MEVQLHAFLIFPALDGTNTTTLPRGDIDPGTHRSGGCVGPTVGLRALEKRKMSRLYHELNHIPPVVQPIASSLYQLSYRSSTLEAAVYIPISTGVLISP
jgi:hypothetical protein